MKKKVLRVGWIIILLVILALICTSCEKKSETKIVMLPSLPRPIAKEPVLITSAGQSTDTYIIRDITNQLLIRNYFMPQVKDVDQRDVNTLILVVGYSPLGMKLQEINYEDERERIEGLLKKTVNEDLTVLTIFIGGKQRRGEKTDELLELIGPYTDYLIGLKESDDDEFMTKLARKSAIPLTLVNSVEDIAEPFASAFR